MLPMLSIPQRLISESAAFSPSTPQSELWLFAVTTALNPAAATAEIKVDGELQLGAPVSSRSCSNSNGARSILVVSSTPAVKSAPESTIPRPAWNEIEVVVLVPGGKPLVFDRAHDIPR